MYPILRRIRDEFFPKRDAFDELTGCDTSGILSRHRLHVNGVRYQAIETPTFRDALSHVHREARNLTFIDLGCGKGRALVLAYQMGFGKIIGVEQSSRLSEVARRNLQTVGAAADIVTSDASAFRFPDLADLVVFMYHPFGGGVMKLVCQNLRRNHGALYLVYVNPVHSDVLLSELPLHKLAAAPRYIVYERQHLD